MRRFISVMLLFSLILINVNMISFQVNADNESFSQNDEVTQNDIEGVVQEENIENEKTELIEDIILNNEEQMEDSANPINPEKGDHANSWRYTDGQLLKPESSAKSRAAVYAYHSNATRTGIDVSEHQGKIDWEKVKESGVDFVILRCGYGMNLTDQDDKFWERNVSECERLGIPYGVYIYSYATNTERALSEAQHVLRLINGHNLSYPVYFDMEDKSTLGSDLGEIAQTFCSTIEKAGYAVGVYANLDWWNNYLTDVRFSQWHRWVAQYNSTCQYSGEYAIWQYTASGRVSGISSDVDMNYLIGYPENHGVSMSVSIPEEVNDVVLYSAHIQDSGWLDRVSNGKVAGTVGLNKQLEAFEISIQNLEGVNIKYSACIDGNWQDYVTDSEVAGTTGMNKATEAIRIKLEGENAENYNIYYRVYINDMGWLGWAFNDEMAGTSGYGYPIEAYQIALLPAGSEAPGDTENAYLKKPSGIKYKAHVQDIGWQGYVENGDTAGTTGRNLKVEALKIELEDQEYEGNVEYCALVQGIGWQDYVSNGEMSGTEGENKKIEAISIKLTGEMQERYDIYYRVHTSDIGWQGWTKNGDKAGTEGYGKKVEAVQIKLVKKGEEAPGNTENAYLKKPSSIKYKAHVQDIGWQGYVENGETAGTTGRNLKVEALKIELEDQEYEGNVEYCALVQGIGWQDYVSNGEMSGTEGENKKIEAISIKLTGEMQERYDIYYRVHTSDIGWQGWTKNGDKAGTEGYGKKVEAVQIKLVKKGEVAPGSVINSFLQK